MRYRLMLLWFRFKLKARIWAISDPGVQWAALSNYGPLMAGFAAAKDAK